MLKAIFAMLAAFVILTTPAVHAAVLVAVAPPTQAVILGSSLEVSVDVSGLGNGTALGAFDINVFN